MLLGLIAGCTAAVFYGSGSVLQAVGARRAAPQQVLDPRLVTRLLGQAPYVAGLALDLAGFAANVVALHYLPLFLVQSLIAGSVGVTAVLAIPVLHARPSPREWLALATVTVGLATLAVAAQPGPARPLSQPAQVALLCALLPLLLAALLTTRLDDRVAGVALAALAGVGFAGVGIAARGLAVPHPWWRLLTLSAAWAIIGFGGAATLLFASALQRGSVTLASAVMFTVETVLPTVVGLLVLGDAVQPGYGAILLPLGLLLTLAGAVGVAACAPVESAAPPR